MGAPGGPSSGFRCSLGHPHPRVPGFVMTCWAGLALGGLRLGLLEGAAVGCEVSRAAPRMALSPQGLVCGLEGETLSQHRAWPSDGVPGREQQAASPRAVDGVTQQSYERGRGRAGSHVTLTEEPDGVWCENTCPGLKP